jgi:hypothetical protein
LLAKLDYSLAKALPYRKYGQNPQIQCWSYLVGNNCNRNVEVNKVVNNNNNNNNNTQPEIWPVTWKGSLCFQKFNLFWRLEFYSTGCIRQSVHLTPI